MTFTYREGLGRPLTWQEMDDNFKAVDEAGQQASQDSQNAANSASSASQSAQSANDSRDVVQLLRDQTQTLKDQTVEISGLDTVAEAVGIINLPYPDVHIPFNDGLRIESGYGTHDQIDVSATQNGSVMVDLPTRSVDFSRASGATGINKSGELVTVGADEPVITQDGLQVFGSFTNYLLHSNLSNYALQGVTTVIQSDGWLRVTEDTAALRQSRLRLDNISVPSTMSLTYTVRVRPQNGRNFILLYLLGNGSNSIEYNLNTLSWFTDAVGAGNTVSGSVKKVGVNEYELTIFLTTPSPVTTTATWLFFSPVANDGNASYQGEGVIGIDVNHGRLVTRRSVPSLIETTGVAVTRSPDLVSIPARNNLPPPGQQFTIAVDVTDIPMDGDYHVLFNVSVKIYLRRFANTNTIGLVAYDGNNSTILAISGNNYSLAGKHRIVCRFTESNLALFDNGVLIDEKPNTTGTYTYPVTGSIELGKIGSGQYLNAWLSGFRIYHTALSNEQIAAMGVPQ